MEEFIEIGRIIKPHGYRGDVTIRIEDSFLGLLEELEFLFIELDGGKIPYEVVNLAPKNNGHYKVLLEDITTEEEAKSLKGKGVYAKTKVAVDFNPDHDADSEYDQFEVIDKEAGMLGVIENLQEFNGNELIHLLREDGEYLMLPLHEDFIVSINKDEKKIHTNYPEGLIELNES